MDERAWLTCTDPVEMLDYLLEVKASANPANTSDLTNFMFFLCWR